MEIAIITALIIGAVRLMRELPRLLLTMLLCITAFTKGKRAHNRLIHMLEVICKSNSKE